MDNLTIRNRDEQTIIAQCTPEGSGALALLRLSGADAITIADQLARLPSKKALTEQTSHTVHYGWIADSAGEKIDQVMFILMHAPKTFTGEHTVEITCHNNPFIINAIIELAITHGARPADNGEFARRAVTHEKMDLVQAEAINDLIGAHTQAALKKSLAQIEGSFSHWLSDIEKRITTALAWSEASFEFLDDDGGFGNQIQEQVANILATITTIKHSFDAQKTIREGIRIALIGSVNAGKSSLFNRLISHDRAIVTDHAGTTRDSIEAGIYRDGMYWSLIDTAGLRRTHDSIEQEGIKRSYEEAHKADIILLVVDGARIFSAEEHTIYHDLIGKYTNKTILIYNKMDSSTFAQPTINHATEPITLSSHTGQNCATLESRIAQKVQTSISSAHSPFLLNKRHYGLLLDVEKKLTHIHALLAQPTHHYELISYHLKDALEHISELTGKSASEAGMDAVFHEFCVGK